MANTDPLVLLRDIHLPDPLSWWPPAPGWWLLAAVCIVLTIAGIVWLWRKQRQLTVQMAALYELAQLENAYQADRNAAAAMKQLSILLRRCSLAAFQDKSVAGLTGEDWLKFLDSTGGNGQFTAGPGRAFLTAPYAPHVDDDINEIWKLCKSWIMQLPKPVRSEES